MNNKETGLVVKCNGLWKMGGLSNFGRIGG